MLLNVLERVMLQDILAMSMPSDFLTLRIVRNLREMVSDSLAGQVEAAGISRNGNQVNWLQNLEDDLSFDDRAEAVVLERLRKLDEQQQLTEDHYTLCEKFGMG